MDTSKISAYSTATVMTTKTTCSAGTATGKSKPPIPDMLDSFREPKVCDILPTSGAPKADAFEEFRPKPRTVLDYNISQTDIKSQARQPLGITKIHIKQTSASYKLPPSGYVFPVEEPPPPPPPEPVVKYSTGRGPLKEFWEEKWMRKVEKQQEAARKNLAKLIVATRKFEKEKLDKDHANLMKLVGTDWFQELSPQQLKTVDNLKNCIVKDVKLKTTCNTQINMAQLGLVLRPNPRHIKIALKKCCECPVEFLLILYQLINKQRTNYSLNDRLLLSAVAHLTMRETLKELHIRIPSPPPPLKKEKEVKKEKKPRYKSPYLVPFTFKPEKAKHSGIYKNNHVQYPESPYFSYIYELKSEVRKDRIEEVEDEDEEEIEDGDAVGNVKKPKKTAQKNEEGKKATKIMITKKQSGISDLQEKELVAELKVAQREYNNLVDYEPVPFLHKPSIYIPCDHGLKRRSADEENEDSSTENETNTTVSVEVRVTTDFDAYCQPVREICECKITFEEVPKHPHLEDSDTNYCRCGELAGSTIPNNIEDENSLEVKKEDTAVIPSIEQVQEPAKQVVEKKTIAVSTDSRDDMPVQSIESIHKQPEKIINASPHFGAEKQNSTDEKEITLAPKESNECGCQEEVERLLAARFCQCDRCKADREAKKQSEKAMLIAELEMQTQQGEEEEEAPTKPHRRLKKPCDCLEQYRANVKMYEEMKKELEAQQHLKAEDQEDMKCACAEIYEEQLKEQRRLTNMPQIPLGRQKYIISGIHETDQGNVFIVGGLPAIEDCPCMKMYKSYESKHLPCLKMYDEYLKKVEMDTQEYMAEVAVDPRFTEEEQAQLTSEDPHEIESAKDSRTESIQTAPSHPPKSQAPSLGSGSKKSTQGGRELPIVQGCTCGVIEESDYVQEITTDGAETNTYSDGKKTKGKSVCICEPNENTCVCTKPDVTQCQCGYDSSSSETSSEESEEPLLKRFIILDKIPCEYQKQMEILKRALEVLAEDGFPLAKLPESYKLPLFKLWMQLRCGKYWLQEDREPILMLSCGHWRHYGYCGRKVRLPKLNMSVEEAHKFTWANANQVRKMATEADIEFYRKVRQANIGDGREFFPSTYSYEFPTPAFRDCYFAYTAGKEEDCVCWRPWYLREVKNFKNRKSCL